MNAGLERAAGAPLASLLYRSTATGPISPAQLDSLVARARRRNADSGITGALYFGEGSFLQWLEGDPATVHDLFDAIGRDRRHSGIRILSCGPVTERMFSGWGLRLVTSSESFDTQCHAVQSNSHPGLPDRAIERVALSLCEGQSRQLSQKLSVAGLRPVDQVRICERVQRAMFALWEQDRVHEIDIAIGLERLLRALRHETPPQLASTKARNLTLVTGFPDEPHLEGTTLASTVLTAAGHSVLSLSGYSMDELISAVQEAECPVAVVTTSSVFAREQQVPALGAFRERLRQVAPDLRCVLYGKLSGPLAAEAGFDGSCRSAAQLPGLFRRGRSAARQVSAAVH